MYLIIGLGNPEQDYSDTRHNMGFDAINKLANEYKISLDKNKFKAIYGIGKIEDKKVILVKPQTFMNLSGESVQMLMQFYKIPEEKLIVIYDDIDLEPEIVKIRKSGGAGTHNGMKSVISLLGTQNFTRIRVGIGKPENKERLIEHVIGAISTEDKEKLNKATTKAKEAVYEIVKTDVDKAMNKIN